MQKVVISTSYGAGFYFTNKTVYNWLNEHGGEGLVVKTPSLTPSTSYRFAHPNLRHHPLVVQCIEELGCDATDYEVEEYDDTKYDCWINDYDGLESLELQPILDVKLILTMSEEELAAYLDDLGIKHNYGR